MSEDLTINDEYISIIYITFFIIVCIIFVWLFFTMGDDTKILEDLSQNEEDAA